MYLNSVCLRLPFLPEVKDKDTEIKYGLLGALKMGLVFSYEKERYYRTY